MMSSIVTTHSQPISQGIPQCSHSSALSPRHPNESAQKKRLFVRKPTPSFSFAHTDKKRKQSQKISQNQKMTTASFKSTLDKQSSKENGQRQQPNQSFTSQGEDKKEGVSWNKSMFFKPYFSQNQVILNLRYIQKPWQRTDEKQLRQKWGMKGSDIDDTSDHSKQSLLMGSKSVNTIRLKSHTIENRFFQFEQHKCEEQSKEEKSNSTIIDSIEEQTQKECLNCKLHIEKCQSLIEKCSKFQDQIEAKNKIINELSQRVEILKIQRAQNERELRRLIQNDKGLRQIIQEFQVRENEWRSTFEGAKKELARFAEKVKYGQMENSMLLRYKEDFCIMVKDCEKLKHENDGLKRQLNSIARMDNNFCNFTKKSKGNQKSKCMKTERQQNTKINYNMTKEDDAVSLNLSQWSCQQL